MTQPVTNDPSREVFFEFEFGQSLNYSLPPKNPAELKTFLSGLNSFTTTLSSTANYQLDVLLQNARARGKEPQFSMEILSMQLLHRENTGTLAAQSNYLKSLTSVTNSWQQPYYVAYMTQQTAAPYNNIKLFLGGPKLSSSQTMYGQGSPGISTTSSTTNLLAAGQVIQESDTSQTIRTTGLGPTTSSYWITDKDTTFGVAMQTDPTTAVLGVNPYLTFGPPTNDLILKMTTEGNNLATPILFEALQSNDLFTLIEYAQQQAIKNPGAILYSILQSDQNITSRIPSRPFINPLTSSDVGGKCTIVLEADAFQSMENMSDTNGNSSERAVEISIQRPSGRAATQTVQMDQSIVKPLESSWCTGANRKITWSLKTMGYKSNHPILLNYWFSLKVRIFCL